MVDTHCHLDMEPMAYHEAEVMARARAAGVERAVTVGVDLASSERAIRIAHAVPGVYAAVGIHPSEVGSVSMDDMERLRVLADDERVVAVGEIGLDYYQLERHADTMPDRITQTRAFDQQVSVAADLGRPVIVHARGAIADAVTILRDYQPEVTALFHSFDGTAKEAALIIEMGGFIGLNNIISYPKNDALRVVVQDIPLDRIVLETDAPFLPPQNRRGTPAEPADVAPVAQLLAELHHVRIEHVVAVTDRTVSAILAI